MNKRVVSEPPPALPPKLYKIRRSELQNNNAHLSSKNIQNGHQNSLDVYGPQRKAGTLLNIAFFLFFYFSFKQRDELVLILLHLNHEKANLLRWKEYFNEQITKLAPAAETDPKAGEEVDSLCLALKDVESQLAACLPITTFLSKKLRMNDVCAGDNSLSGSPAYERASLQYGPNVSLTRQKSINFLRREEEREVARALKAKLSRNSTALAETYGVVTASRMLEHRKRQPSVESPRVIKLQDYPEEPAFRERRLQLESELKKLDELWKEACEYSPVMSTPISKTVSSSCRRQKSSVLRRLESRKLDSSEVTRPLSACDVTNLAYVPRRSTRRLYRSDLSSSFSADLERRPARSQSQSSLCRNPKAVESPRHLRAVNRSVSSASIGRLSEKQKQRHSSENSRIYTAPKPKNQAASGISSFLMEPTQAVQSRWKVSTDEEDGSSSNSVFSSHPPPPLPLPPMPERRKSSSLLKSPPQLNRWRSFGFENRRVFKRQLIQKSIQLFSAFYTVSILVKLLDEGVVISPGNSTRFAKPSAILIIYLLQFQDNLMQVDPQLRPRIGGSNCSEGNRNFRHQTKSRTSGKMTPNFAMSNHCFILQSDHCFKVDSSQPTLLEGTDDVFPVPSEDFYEKEPFVESPYLTPRDLHSSSTGANGQTLEEQPLSASFLTTAVEYIPSEANYDTTEGNSVTTWTYPPDLTKEPANKRALALPKPNKNEKKPLTLPISMFSAFRIPEKSFGLHHTQSAI
ncbi:unnamed protein product [Rodentolepis nana]|uniref:CAP-Gly domain-containing protein n=1 Tax=Rodentolepis nana TaxID=102285 RepID=A0A158QI64_RODNA|nr:unnamed protein product [Rodentolepis nana]